MPAASELSLFTTEVKVKPEALEAFALRQAHFNETVAMQKGFISLEILNQDKGWILVKRIPSAASLSR